MPRIVISGSITYDTLLGIDTNFRETLQSPAKSLSVGYHANSLHRLYGGNAANIAFHLARLGLDAAPVCAVGNDFAPYNNWLLQNGVDLSLLSTVDSLPTAQVYILSDAAENQVLTLYRGAMEHSCKIELDHLNADLAVVGPDDRDAMMRRIDDFARFELPVVFDPGQSLTSLDRHDIDRAIAVSRWVIVNESEAALLQKTSRRALTQIAADIDALIVTMGSRGCRILADGAESRVDAARPQAVVDPTGCGDAFRAGFLKGLLAGALLEEAAALGAEVAAETLGHLGAQWQAAQ